VVLSGVSLIGSAEVKPGHIVQDDKDRLLIGAFDHPHISQEFCNEKSKDFVEMYGKGGKTDCKFSPNVLHDRWRKLVYNACLNPICAITGLDTGLIRLADGAVEGLVRPAMKEIVAAARKLGVDLGDEVVDHMINIDPLDLYLAPSMLADVKKVRFIICLCGSTLYSLPLVQLGAVFQTLYLPMPFAHVLSFIFRHLSIP
jgi:ketopantoate reductase